MQVIEANGSRVVDVGEQAVSSGTGAATASVTRLSVRVATATNEEVVTVIRKRCERLRSGRHAALAGDPRHWAYWRREAEAYASGILPQAPGGIRAPVCLGVIGDEIFLEDVGGEPASVQRAARDLSTWQVDDQTLDRPWIGRDQLGRRLEVGALDWSTVDADERVVELWSRRTTYHNALSELPVLLAHGDFSLGNLRSSPSGTVALDWATLGWEPVGFDLAHLGLSTGVDPTSPYLDGDNRFAGDAVVFGFRAATAIVGASRVHWMMSAGLDVPAWYIDFLWDHRPIS